MIKAPNERQAMANTIENIAFDCGDPYRLALFWSQVTGRPIHPDDEPGDPVAIILGGPGWPTLYFQQVPEPKTVKNRAHICLCPDTPRDAEADRLLALGATIEGDHREGDGSGHIVFADPEGNEFCLLRSRAELPLGHIRLDVHAHPTAAEATTALTQRLAWRGGQTDLWPLLADPTATDAVAHGLAEPFHGIVDVVLGPDPGGVLFGPLVAGILHVPFAPVCRDRDFFFQGPHETAASGKLLAHRAALPDGARVLLVDDWSETGGTLSSVADLVASTGAVLSGVSLLVDSLPDSARERLLGDGIDVHALVTPQQLR